MTPKEKAEELVGKYYFQVQTLEQQKQCALIAVDEIINNDGFTKFDDYLTEYWQEVKKEIEKL